MYCVQHCASYFFVTIVRVFPNFRWDDEWASFPTHFKVFLCNDHILSPDAIRRTCVREESWGWSSDTRGIHTFGPKGPECWLWHMELHQAFLGEFAQDFLCRKLLFFCCSLLLFQHQQHLHTVKRVSRCKIMQKISGWCHVGHGILILLRDWKMGFAWHPQIMDLWTSKLCDWYCAIKIHGWGWQEN